MNIFKFLAYTSIVIYYIVPIVGAIAFYKYSTINSPIEWIIYIAIFTLMAILYNKEMIKYLKEYNHE